MSTEAPLSFEVVDTLEGVASLAAPWEALLERSRCNRAFSSPQWFMAACRAARLPEPRVIVARSSGALRALLPLALNGEGNGIVFPTFFNDYNDLIASSEDLPAMVGTLAYASQVVDGMPLVLSRLHPDSHCLQALSAWQGPATWRLTWDALRPYPYVRVAGSHEQYMQTRSRALFRELRRFRQRAAQHQVVLRELEPGSLPPAALPEVFLSLHLSRFTKGSVFMDPTARDFVTGLLPLLFAQKRVRVFALMEGARPVAMDLCMRGANSLACWNGGFLPEVAQWSPGKLLLEAEIQEAHESGLEEFDLMRGGEEYKSRWATHTRLTGMLELQRAG
jgi:CelD/BcsL family acetyltransferase involved in cellulose biosynthesis